MADDPSSKAKFAFATFRNAWLDQVVADVDLPPMAFKLAWHFMKDVQRTHAKRGQRYSYRSQHSYADLLSLGYRQIGELFRRLRERGHIEVRRGGKNHPNSTYPVLFDMQNTADQERALISSPEQFDRQSDDILTGEKLPRNLIEQSVEDNRAGKKPAPVGQRSTVDGSGDALPSVASPPILQTYKRGQTIEVKNEGPCRVLSALGDHQYRVKGLESWSLDEVFEVTVTVEGIAKVQSPEDDREEFEEDSF